ncbi:hypothetical protein ES705_07388 [subsurface metagenome]
MTNFEKSRIYNINNSVDYSQGAIVSKIVEKKDTGSVTLFAFEKGQYLSEHTAPYDALLHIIEGNAKIMIDTKSYLLKEGDMIIMPANIPHAVEAVNNFKMLLTMIKA